MHCEPVESSLVETCFCQLEFPTNFDYNSVSCPNQRNHPVTRHIEAKINLFLEVHQRQLMKVEAVNLRSSSRILH